MILSDDDIQLAETLTKLDKNKLTQNDKAIIKKFIEGNLFNYLNVFQRIIEIYKNSDDAVKNISNRYNLIGLDSFLDFKYLKKYITYVLESLSKSPKEKLDLLKEIFELNKSCPVIEIKNGIILSVLRYLVLFGGVERDSNFINEVLSATQSLTAEEKAMAVTVI